MNLQPKPVERRTGYNGLRVNEGKGEQNNLNPYLRALLMLAIEIKPAYFSRIFQSSYGVSSLSEDQDF
jgi:hypothetical protein